MVTLAYEIGCRSCHNSDGVKHMYQIQNGKSADFLVKTDFEMVQTIEKWRKQDGHRCQYCDSENVEVSDVEVNGQSLYSFNALVYDCQCKDEEMFMISIDRDDFGIELNHGGSNNPDPKFVKQCISMTIKYLEKLPDSQFVSHVRGSSFICFTGLADFWGNKIKLQQFRHSGLLKKEIIDAIKKELRQYR